MYLFCIKYYNTKNKTQKDFLVSKSFSYLLVFIIIIGILILLIIEDSPNQTVSPVAVSTTKPKQEQPKDKKPKKEITINFIEGKKKQEKSPDKPTQKRGQNKTVTETEEEPASNKVYELVNAATRVDTYYINVVSDSPIPRRNPNAFPQIPATILGMVDGKPFSLTVPSDLGVEDFKVRIKDEDTGKIHIVALEKEHTKPGSSTVLNVDTNNLENIELRVSSSANVPPPPPPLPPIN